MAQQFYDTVNIYYGLKAQTTNQPIDLNLNEVKKLVLERVTSLPTQTGLEQKGRLIIHSNDNVCYYHNGGISSTASENWIAFAKAQDLSNYMLKSVYDTDDNGTVDNSEKLGGKLPAYYLNMSNSELTGVLAIARGGTGLSTLGGQNKILGANSANSALEYKTLSGTTNRVTVTHETGAVTLSAPQDLHSGANIAFNTVTIAGTVANANHAATKAYVDSMAIGLQVKTAVVCATTSNITLSGLQTIDGITLATGNRVLVKNQTDGRLNGIYAASTGTWTRALDADASSELRQAYVWVENGDIYGDQSWICTVLATFVLGTDACTWEKFSAAGRITPGIALSKSGETLNVLYDDHTIGVNGNNKLYTRIAGTNHDPCLEENGSTSTGGTAYGLAVKVKENGGISRTGDGLVITAGYGYKVTTGTLLTPEVNTDITITHGLGTIPINFECRTPANSPIYPEIVSMSDVSVVIKFNSGSSAAFTSNVIWYASAQRTGV